MTLPDRALAATAALALRCTSALTGPRLSILIFHRVLRERDPIFPDEVDAARFDRLMGLVACSFHVMPLAEAAGRLTEGTLPRRALSITFDDGYADNHDVALPILQRHGLTACFFVATGFLDGGRMFNDTVIECVRSSTRPQIDLSEFGQGSVALSSPLQRAAAIEAMLSIIKYLGPNQRPQALERVRALCQPHTLPDDLMMSRTQVRALHAAGMEIGAHTVRHPILCTLPDVEVEHEMVASRNALQAMIDHPVTLFAYPNGQPDRDYAYRHARMAQRLGFAAGVTTAPGTAGTGDDAFQLPRFTPWDRAPAFWMTRLIAARRRHTFSVAQAPRDAGLRRAATGTLPDPIDLPNR